MLKKVVPDDRKWLFPAVPAMSLALPIWAQILTFRGRCPILGR